MLFLLGVLVIATSMIAMIAIARQSRFVPHIAVIAGAAGIFFFWNLRFFVLPGLLLSTLAVLLAVFHAAKRERARTRRIMVLSESGVWRLPTEVFLSDSGRWRTL
jgi:hypothetical protein